MGTRWLAVLLFSLSTCAAARGDESSAPFSGVRKQNNLVAELLRASTGANSGESFHFARGKAGWVFVSANCQGTGTAKIVLDPAASNDLLIDHAADPAGRDEAMRWVTAGEHEIRVQCGGELKVAELVVKSIPELMHCGLGFDPAIKSYGHYDLDFLRRDILPNVTTLIVPSNIRLPPATIESWHRQGKRFVAEVGIDSRAKTADDHLQFWSGIYDKAPFLDGIIINEFIVNAETVDREKLSPERLQRLDDERARNRACETTFKTMRATDQLKNKSLFAYIGGSGKKLNQDVLGTTFAPTLVDCDYRIALERYLHEMSSEERSQQALQTFVEGIADWEAKAPGVKEKMIIAFGLFSMPPGGINKQPNVDYHVWMD